MKFIEDQSISDKSDRVSIVSIIGKSALQSCNAKATCIPEWIGQSLFNSKLHDETLLFKDDVRSTVISFFTILTDNIFFSLVCTNRWIL